jgi:phage shock protein C
MTTKTTNLFLRDDTIFGVCQAIGDDFGFNPLWLRLALAAPVMFQSYWGIVAYGVLAIAVFASRLIAPTPRKSNVVTLPKVETVASAPVEREPLALAA